MMLIGSRGSKVFCQVRDPDTNNDCIGKRDDTELLPVYAPSLIRQAGRYMWLS